MMINNNTIIKDSDARIREISQPVPLPLLEEDKQILRDLYQYVQDSVDPEKSEKLNLRPAVGISAIQVGIAKQLTAVIVPIRDADGNETTQGFMLANPRIVSSSVQQAYLESGEGCLSVESEHSGYVPRSARITVKAYDLLTERDVTIRARGYLAIVLQHELDHFKGILFYDHINQKEPFKEIEGALVI